MNNKIKILVNNKEIDYYAFADLIRNGDYFFKENGEWYLHKRPTIEEDKKIEKIKTKIGYGHLVYLENENFSNGDMGFTNRENVIVDKINEIIDYLNKENK